MLIQHNNLLSITNSIIKRQLSLNDSFVLTTSFNKICVNSHFSKNVRISKRFNSLSTSFESRNLMSNDNKPFIFEAGKYF